MILTKIIDENQKRLPGNKKIVNGHSSNSGSTTGSEKTANEIIHNINFHSTSHTYATKYLEKGGDIETLQHNLGHENISTTMVYANITYKKMAKDINARVAY